MCIGVCAPTDDSAWMDGDEDDEDLMYEYLRALVRQLTECIDERIRVLQHTSISGKKTAGAKRSVRALPAPPTTNSTPVEAHVQGTHAGTQEWESMFRARMQLRANGNVENFDDEDEEAMFEMASRLNSDQIETMLNEWTHEEQRQHNRLLVLLVT